MAVFYCPDEDEKDWEENSCNKFIKIRTKIYKFCIECGSGKSLFNN